MTIKSGTGQACAACKYQRRRCTRECLLAPFFPADQPKMFQNVHRLFGVKNIQNLLKELGPDQNQKAIAMRSIKFHAAMRDKYPVLGCLYEIHQLNCQIQIAEEELQGVLQQLAYYRHQNLQQHNNNNNNNNQEISISSPVAGTTDDYISELQLGMGPPINAAVALVQDHESHHHPRYFMPYSDSGGGNGEYNINYLEFKENVNNNFSNISNENNNAMQQQQQQQKQQQQQQQQHLMMQQALKQETGQDYNEMQHYFDNIDDTHSYIGSKDACESSLESSLKDSRAHLVEEMGENELKSVASNFSLISLN